MKVKERIMKSIEELNEKNTNENFTLYAKSVCDEMKEIVSKDTIEKSYVEERIKSNTNAYGILFDTLEKAQSILPKECPLLNEIESQEIMYAGYIAGDCIAMEAILKGE